MEVAGLTLVQRLASDAVLARAFGVVEGTYWLTTGLGSLMSLHPLAGDIRTPDDVGKSDPRLRQLLYFDFLEEGYYTAGRGYMALSLKVSDEHCDGFCAAIERVVTRRHRLFSPA